jgi:Lipase
VLNESKNSGQMVGKIGRHVKKLSGGVYSISSIFALDPAGPGFERDHLNDFEALSSTDANYVQVIHTDAGTLGMQFRSGTIGM